MSTPEVRVRLSPEGLAEVRRALRTVERDANRVAQQSTRGVRLLDNAIQSFGANVRRLGLIGVTTGVAALGSTIVRTSRDFQLLNAQLETIEGSSEGARLAFEEIQNFAATTPFQLDEVVDAFIRLRNRGLDAGEESLRAYGNTAAAMSRSLEQVIEAVADATTFQFERLREFGITASQESDRVRFTFRGTTTEVGKNAREIEQFLRRIGEVEFAGSVDRQMSTLDGAASNLSDAFQTLALRIDSKTGLTGAITAAIRGLTDLVNTAAGVPRQISDIEADIQRLNEQLAAAPDPGTQASRRRNRGQRGGGNRLALEEQLQDLQAELQAALLASTEVEDVQRGIDLVEERIAELTASINERRARGEESEVGRGRNRRLTELGREEQQLRRLQAELERYLERRDQLRERNAEEDPAEAEAAPIDAVLSERLKIDKRIARQRQDQLQAEERGFRAIFELQQALSQARGNEREADLRALDAEIAKYEAALRQAGLLTQRVQADLAALRETSVARIDFGESVTAAQQALDDLARARERIEEDVVLGINSQLEGQRRIVELEQQRLPILRQLAAAARAAAEATGDPELVRQAQLLSESIDQIARSVANAGTGLDEFRTRARDAAQSDLSNFLAEGITEAKNFEDAFLNLARSIIDSIRRIAAELLAQRIFDSLAGFGLFGGGGGGGASVSAAGGGYIRGPGTSTSDSIPARLSDGEFVVKAAAVRQPGALSLLRDLNAMRIRPMRPRGFAEGGLVEAPGPVNAAASLRAEIGLQDGLVASQIQSKAGERAVLRVIQRNQRRIGRFVRR